MMRYQGLSQDSLPLSNGRRSQWRTCKDDDGIMREIDDDVKTIPSFTETKGLPRFRSPSSKPQDQNFSHFTATHGGVPNSPPQSKTTSHHETGSLTKNPIQELKNNSPIRNGGDMLLQWGHRKRSRCSRTTETRTAMAVAATGPNVTTDESSSSSSTQIQAMIKLQRANLMPPPPSIVPTTISTANGKSSNLKSCSKDTPAFISNRRNMEERSGVGSGSQPTRSGGGCGNSSRAVAAYSSRSKVGKRSPTKLTEKHDHKKLNGCSSSLVQQEQETGKNHVGCAPPQSTVQQAGCSGTNNNHDDNSGKTAATGGGGEKVNEWPRVYIQLTRKEKEEDFLAMKGTKLPHRPKKRPKTVDRTLQYCFPGMWLSDVTKARYEVKEKKCTKKPKRRGLKGMESMESDSD